MLISLLTLVSMAPAQEPVGGWHAPIWSIDSDLGQGVQAKPLVDFDGDSVPEVFVQHGTVGELVSGATGLALIRQQVPFGGAHAEAADLDGDGAPELVLFEPDYSEAGLTQCGRITAWAGAPLQPLWRARGEQAQDQLGRKAELVDMSGDGLPEVRQLRGIAGASAAIVLDGRTGQRVWSHRGLAYDWLDWCPDLDGDGIDEVLLGRQSGLAALNGADGQLLWQSSSYFNQSVRWDSLTVGELDGTAGLELCIGVPRYRPSGASNPGAIQVVQAESGILAWEQKASVQFDRMAEQIVLTDRNGDGREEVLSLSTEQAVLFDGGNGNAIWTRSLDSVGKPHEILLFDLTGDQRLDFVTWRLQTPGFLEAFDGVSGASLWRVDANLAEESFRNGLQTDLDGDGVTDFLVASPEATVQSIWNGVVRAISGANGQALWGLTGTSNFSRMGQRLALAELDGTPGPEVLVQAPGPPNSSPDSGLYAVDGASGQQLWFSPQPAISVDYEQWTIADLDHDGAEDWLAVGPAEGSEESRVRLASGTNGNLLWAHRLPSAERNLPTVVLAVFPDLNGDGVDEVLWTRALRDGSEQLEVVSGADLDYRAGLVASADQLSLGAGGTIQLDLAMPAASARHFFQLLASTRGTGPTEFIGLSVPLSSGPIFQRLASGLDRGVFRPQIGRLDAAAQAQIDMQVAPGMFGGTLVGRTLHIAVITQPTPSVAPERVTQAVAIQLLP